jgi:hypothetical protein
MPHRDMCYLIQTFIGLITKLHQGPLHTPDEFRWNSLLPTGNQFFANLLTRRVW